MLVVRTEGANFGAGGGHSGEEDQVAAGGPGAGGRSQAVTGATGSPEWVVECLVVFKIVLVLGKPSISQYCHHLQPRLRRGGGGVKPMLLRISKNYTFVTTALIQLIDERICTVNV